MPFRFCDSMIHRYRTDGYVIFRQILPPSLIRDLRRGTAKVHETARAQRGGMVQRLQPITRYPEAVDLAPFRDYMNHAPLVDAVKKVLTPQHKLDSDMSEFGLLIEPAEVPYCTDWHRDVRENHPGIPDVEEFRRVSVDPLFFNQINCPLYEDNCTWYVPGSYLRTFDLPAETEAATKDSPNLLVDEATNEERERRCLEYCQRMPRGIRASMDAGDFMLYHPLGWHLGNYLPGRRRMTLHHFAGSPPHLDWYRRWRTPKPAAAAV